MRFLSDLPLLVVGIAVAAFLIKLFVSLWVANKAPVLHELGDQEPGAVNTDRAAAGIRAEQLLLDADAVPEQKPVEQQCPEYPGEHAHAASGVVQ
jgi:hypothetical protein